VGKALGSHRTARAVVCLLSLDFQFASRLGNVAAIGNDLPKRSDDFAIQDV
jgi:hypothetical protein